MKYILLIHQGDTPTPLDPEAWGRLSEEEQKQVFADYQAINQTPGVSPGEGLETPDAATTVRVQDGKTLTTYQRAIELTRDDTERRLFERRLASVSDPPSSSPRRRTDGPARSTARG
jgi:hypothetical protein